MFFYSFFIINKARNNLGYIRKAALNKWIKWIMQTLFLYKPGLKLVSKSPLWGIRFGLTMICLWYKSNLFIIYLFNKAMVDTRDSTEREYQFRMGRERYACLQDCLITFRPGVAGNQHYACTRPRWFFAFLKGIWNHVAITASGFH